MGQEKSPEAAQLVMDQKYSIREAAEAMNVAKTTIDKWGRQLRSEREGKPTTAAPMIQDQRRNREPDPIYSLAAMNDYWFNGASLK